MTDKKDIKPREFAEIPEADFDIPNRDKHRKKPQIYFANDLIAIYTAFRDQVYNPQSVLYPSSGFDGSPAKVFDNVTFVDIENGNEGCVKKFQEVGLHALKQDIKIYTPKDLHDLLILLNPSIPTEWASRHLKSGGYVLANNYHGNASEMYGQPDQFTLWGIIDLAEREKGKEKATVSRNLEGLFKPVKDEAELKQFRPTCHKFLQGVFKTFAMNMANFNTDRPFDQVWIDYREMMQEGMPSRRVADGYIFAKK